jgi:hypothetical protein
MPFKFACPQCQQVLSVPSKLAGKVIACPKCRAKVPVPKPKSVASQPATTQTADSDKLSRALSELTESDFNRRSPFESVYAPPKPQATNHELIRRVSEQDARSSKKTGKASDTGMPAVLVLYVLHNILESLIFFTMAVLLGVALDMLNQVKDQVPLLGAGVNAGIATFALLATVMLVTAIFILIKRQWGYAVATAAYLFFCIIHLVNVFANRGDRNAAVGAAITLVLTVFLTTYFFRGRCKKFYRVQGWILPAASAGVGVLLGAICSGILYSMGIFQIGGS